MSNNFVPQKGDIIDWEGNFIGPNIANAHLIRIFRNE